MISPINHISLSCLWVLISEITTSKPLCASITSTIVTAPIRKNADHFRSPAHDVEVSLAVGTFAEVDGFNRHHHPHRTRRTDHVQVQGTDDGRNRRGIRAAADPDRNAVELSSMMPLLSMPAVLRTYRRRCGECSGGADDGVTKAGTNICASGAAELAGGCPM